MAGAARMETARDASVFRSDGGGSPAPDSPEPVPAGEWTPPCGGLHLAEQPVPASRQGGE